MTTEQRIDDILAYWFGRIEDTVLPSENRSKIWFANNPDIDHEIKEKFGKDVEHAILDKYEHWEDNSRGTLALIILLDQFSRNIYRHTPMAFAQDLKALDLCVRGIERQYDHALSLIERAFFYMPLMHSENIDMQNTSVRAFKMLVDLSFPEARPTFENFFDFALKHYQVIERFGRYPSRNKILGRDSTKEELDYLKEGGVF